jgi:predicted nucleic acid-binding protein
VILLDTNVISELMRANPEPSVQAWMDECHRGDIGVSAISVAEILYGIGSLPEGRKQSELLEAAADVFDGYFDERVFAFDRRAAVHYAEVVCRRERMGAPISMADAQIAAVCLSHGAGLATRNTRDFENTGVVLVDPWIRM